MILLDAFALVAWLTDEEAATEVEALLRAGGCAVSAVNLAETADVLSRVHGLRPGDVEADVMLLVHTGHLEVQATTGSHAWRAAEVRRDYYAKSRSELSLADCVLLAHAGSEDRIATADPVVAEVARKEGLDLVALPDSSGRRP